MFFVVDSREDVFRQEIELFDLPPKVQRRDPYASYITQPEHSAPPDCYRKHHSGLQYGEITKVSCIAQMEHSEPQTSYRNHHKWALMYLFAEIYHSIRYF